MKLLSSLYFDIIDYIYKNNIRMFPLEINHIFYDPKYSYLEDIEMSSDKENIFMDADFYYRKLFSEIDKYLNQMTYIINSDDIGEDESITGDYYYYSGIITPEIPFLFEMSTHPCHYPNRIIIFGSFHQIEISTDISTILVYDIVMNTRCIFLSNDISQMSTWLKGTDRPVIYK